MPAFQLSPCAAALVSDNSAVPTVSIVTVSAPGFIVAGHDAVRQLRDACNLALYAADAFTNPSTSKGTEP